MWYYSTRYDAHTSRSIIPKVWRVVCFTAATTTTLSLSGMVWRMRTDLQNLNTYTTTHSHDTQDHRRGRDISPETHTCTQLSCRRQGSPTAIDYRSGERARITMRPQTKCARSQGTTSPQISVTFRRFIYQPIIWHRGPRSPEGSLVHVRRCS